MSIGLLGQKIGMTSVYDANGRLHPVTVIAAGDNALLRRLTNENDGYSAVQVGFDSQKESRVNKAELGVFKSANSEPKRFVREFRLTSDLAEGEVDLTVTQFQSGDFVDVIGRSKGKGFQGVMKKHNFDGQGAAHGSKTHRRNGAVRFRAVGCALPIEVVLLHHALEAFAFRAADHIDKIARLELGDGEIHFALGDIIR